MSRLIIFGDSFAEPYEANFELWTEQLAKKLDLELVNCAKGGTSFIWTLCQYDKYMQGDYREDDYIIVVVTTGTRLPYIHPDFSLSTSMHPEYDSNWVKYWTIDGHLSQLFLLCETLKALPNKKLVIRAFDGMQVIGTRFSKYDFFVLGNPLVGISTNENYVLPVGARDTRPNHMSEPNHKMLANDIYQISLGSKQPVIDAEEYWNE